MNKPDNKPSRKPATADLYAAIMEGQRKTISNIAFQRAFYLHPGTAHTFDNCKIQGINNPVMVDATFVNCELTGYVLRSVTLVGCTFRNCTGIDLQAPQYRALPVGQFTAYKRVSGAILELLVSKKAQRVSAPSNNERKYRVSKVLVKRALLDDGTAIQGLNKFCSLRNPSFVYEVGKWVEEPNFDPDPTTVCTRGSHIFLTFEEARDYR